MELLVCSDERISRSYLALLVIAALAVGLAAGSTAPRLLTQTHSLTATTTLEKSTTVEKPLTTIVINFQTETLARTFSVTSTVEAESKFPREKEILDLASKLGTGLVLVFSDLFPSSVIGAGATGFIVHPKGYVLTNRHVFEGGKTFEVVLVDGRSFTAKLIAKTAPQGPDLAVLKIDAEAEFTALKFGDTKELREGDTVFAIGNPKFFGKWVSIAGEFLSITKLSTPNQKEYSDITVNAPGSSGESGSPVFNLQGRIVGIVWGGGSDPEAKKLGSQDNVVVWFGNVGKYWKGVFSAGLTTGTIYNFLKESVGEQLANEIFTK